MFYTNKVRSKWQIFRQNIWVFVFVYLKVAVISKDWVLDSVGSFELKSIAAYVTGDIEKSELIDAGYAVWKGQIFVFKLQVNVTLK